MVGYWPGSFFASLWTETQLRSINTQKKKKKKRSRPTSRHLDRTSLDLLYGFRELFLRGTPGCPEQAR